MQQTFDPQLLQKASEAQALALDAAHSVWISANAGTGKTEVLTRRMLALLLHDPSLEPRHLLALTFTKAGAAEMAARLPARLASWAALDADTLPARVREETGMTVPDVQARVRQLAEAVRKAPPMVSTIHGLAQQVLGRFTVEAGFPLDFEVLEDGAQKRLLRDVQRSLLVDVDGPLAEHLGILLDQLGDKGWEELTNMIVYGWHKLEALLAGAGLGVVLERLERELQIDATSGRPLMPSQTEWEAIARIGAALPAREDVQAVLTSHEARREATWRAFLLTKDNTARKRMFVKAELAVLDERDVALIMAASERAEAQLRARRVYRGFEVTRSALLWAAAVRGAYVQRKRVQGLVDFSDLLDGLERVMGSGDSTLTEWVWYGLDRRFRHLVVDEAQDNNPQQDRIIRWLAQSILSGDVGEGAPRTVLAVGDMKQSIFRFQGAVPELFVGLGRVLADWAAGMRNVDLTHSFRSGRHVLELVDRVFQQGDSAAVVMGSDLREWPSHIAVAAGRASRVEIWPTVEKADKPDVAPWALAHERAAAGGQGEDIACLQQVGAWLQSRVGRVVMPSTGAALRWEDVMIVVQRNKIAAMAAGVLRGMGIPVAAAGGVLPLVVDDAIACVRVIFNPADNLALAQVLKGLRGWDDGRLLQLAERAGVGTRASGDEEAVWSDFLEGDDKLWFASLRQMAWDAPAAVVQRVMHELRAEPGLFVTLLEWAEASANLRELVDRLELDDLPAASGGEGLRVLTVHGSKGLQAPLVILPDTMAALASLNKDKLLWDMGADGDVGGVVLYKQAKGLSALEDRLADAELARKKADSLRGLYVAMTRAMDWLVVTGFGDTKQTTDTWWTRIKAGFGDASVVGEAFAECEPVVQAGEVTRVLPVWVETPAQVALVGEVQSAAQVRGEAVHALLQGLEVAADAEARAEAEGVRQALPWLWAKSARSEMAVGLGQGKVGRIDRLVEKDGEWWVIDFKTGAIPAQMPESYAAQVRGYVEALRQTWPQRSFRAGIVWTAVARLDEVRLA